MLVGSLIALAACTAPSTPPASTSGAPATPTASSASPDPASSFDPDATAEANLPLFTEVTNRVWASKSRAHGRAYIDALVAVGFDKSAMQVTNDRTTVGQAAESIQFSVLVDGACLVGQVGPATGDPVTAVLPALPGGRCLVGETETIDW